MENSVDLVQPSEWYGWPHDLEREIPALAILRNAVDF